MKFLIISMLILSSMIPLFSTNYFICWFFLEICNLLFITYLLIMNENKSSIMLYFFIQVITSSVLMFTILIFTYFKGNTFMNLIMTTILLIKIGVPPFHLWIITLTKSFKWFSLFLLMTFMKIIPFFMISLNHLYIIILSIILIMSSLLPLTSIINITNIKQILIMSSIYQSSWLLLLIFFKKTFWLEYFIMYSFLTLCMLNYMDTFKMYFQSNNTYFKKMIPQGYMEMLSLSIMFNFSGLPPFSFFMAKWLSIEIITMYPTFIIIMILFMISSMIMLFIYVNMFISNLFIFKSTPKSIKSPDPLLIPNILIFISMSLLISMLIIIM